MSKKRLLIIAVIGVTAVVIDVWISTDVLQRFAASIRASFVNQTPLESIRESLRQQTPVGTSSAEVHVFVNKQGWRLLRDFSGSGGFYGQACIAADLGCYRLSGEHKLTDVRAMWGLDHSNRLVVVDVWEMTGQP